MEAAMTTTPIRDLALLSDWHSSALVDRRRRRVARVPALRQPVGRRRGCSTTAAGTGGSGRWPTRPAVDPERGATSTARWCSRRRSGRRGHAGPHRRPGHGRGQRRRTGSAAMRRTCSCAGSPARQGAVEIEVSLRAPPGVRARRAPAVQRRRRRRRPRRRRVAGADARPVDVELDAGAGPRPRCSSSAGDSCTSRLHRSTLERRRPARLDAGELADAARPHDRRRGGRGRTSTSRTRARGRTWCTPAGGCCRR